MSTITKGLLELAEGWRERAADLRRLAAAEGAAQAWEVAAEEIEQFGSKVVDHLDETLNLEEAAEESGYSSRHLRRLIRQGQLPDAGRRNAPRVRRGDLPPRKPGLTGTHFSRQAAAYDTFGRTARAIAAGER